jgi:hypothetical protein
MMTAFPEYAALLAIVPDRLRLVRLGNDGLDARVARRSAAFAVLYGGNTELRFERVTTV